MSRSQCGTKAVQGWDAGAAALSKVWTIALALAASLWPGVTTRGAGQLDASERFNAADGTNTSERPESGQRELAWAIWIGAGDGPGPADAAHLSAAWERAGGVNLAVLTGKSVQAEAVLAALLRLRARLQTGDVAVVGYSGPVALSAEGEPTRRWVAVRGDDAQFAVGPSVVDTVLESSGAIGLLVEIVAARAARRADAAGAPKAGSEGKVLRWIAGTLDGPAESWSGRTRAADALARELDRLRERAREGTVEGWLRAAARRCALESAGRTTCDVVVPVAYAEPARWPMRGAGQPAREPVGSLGGALERLAAMIETHQAAPESDDLAVWEAARIAAREAQSPQLAEWIEDLMIRRNIGRLSAAQWEDGYEAAASAWRAERLEEAERKLEVYLRGAGAPASLRALMAEVRWARGDETGAVAMARAALSAGPASEGSEAPDPRAVFHASRVLAMAAERHGDAAEAERHYRAAVEAGQDERVREGRARAEARRGLARALRLQRRAVEAVAELEAALAVVRADPAARPEMPLLLAELGEAQAATGHLDAAIEAWRSACDEWREARGSAPPLSVVLKLAGALLERGGIEEAIRRLQSALDHPEEVSAPLAERMEAHRLLGWAWNRRGEPVLALRHAREAWRLATSAPAVSSAERAIVYADLAALHLAIGDAARAADFAQNAVAEWGRASLTNQESLAAAWVLLGEANNRLQRYLDAARAWSNAAVAVAGTGGDRRLQWVRTRTQETRAWVEAGVPGAAIAASDALAGVLESFGAELPPRLRAEAGLQRARALEAAGRSDEADRAYAQAMAALEDTVASSEEAVLRAEIAVRWAVLRTARGRLFGAQEALTAVRAVPDGLGRELTATARRLRAHLQEMMKPHGPITMPADIMAIQELEREYRARRPREAATEERAEAAQRSGP